MSTSLLTQSQKDAFVLIAEKHMPTFAQRITIHKEPTQVIASNNINIYPGYKDTSSESNISYIPVNQAFSGLIVKGKTQDPLTPSTLNDRIWQSETLLKVERDARDFILNGKTIKIVTQGKTYDVVSGPIPQNYLGLLYYYFLVQETA